MKTNNSRDNLEYVPQAENNRHAFRLGLNKYNLNNLTSEHFKLGRKLTDEQVVAIRRLKGEASVSEIARRYAVHDSTVSRILSGLRRNYSKPEDAIPRNAATPP